MTQLGVDPAPEPGIRIVKMFKIVPKRNVQLSSLGPAAVEMGMKRQLMVALGEAIPFGPCLFDWKIEQHTVDELDESGRRWPNAHEGDMIIQGYVRYQIPEVKDGI